MMIELVNLRTCKDFGTKKGDVRIDRTTIFGNPFPIGTCTEDGIPKNYTRTTCISRYAKYIENADVIIIDGKRYDGLKVRLAIKALAREDVKRLGCWCAPLKCHGEIIRDLIIREIIRDLIIKEWAEIDAYNQACEDAEQSDRYTFYTEY